MDGIQRERLRRLVEIRLDRPVVLSLYLDLDPSEFATPPARATAIRSLLDQADRAVRDQDGLSHKDRNYLVGSLERARGVLTRNPDTEGAQGLALFACEPADLLDLLKLPRPVANRVAIDRSPFVGPLAGLERRERWCVALVNRRDARLFRGSPDGLREVEKIHDDVHGQHDQGGLSQARYQRSVEKEVADHLKGTAERLLRHYERQPFERLVLGGPREIVADFEDRLHGYLTERLAGRIEVDVETATPDALLEAARGHFEKLEDEREREAIGRLEEGSRAVSGPESVLRPLNERRVEVLLLDERFAAPGTRCPSCGWLGPPGETSCLADGSPLEERDDLAEPAIELALQQSAEVLPLRRHAEELRERGGIAALLRF